MLSTLIGSDLIAGPRVKDVWRPKSRDALPKHHTIATEDGIFPHQNPHEAAM